MTEVRTGEKLKDDALRENLILLQEVRHRVANSLQIIASVPLQNAKWTQSEETRGHPKGTHHRVTSIAALERQFAGTGDIEVELLGYFSSLCASISASMIGDRDQISLTVTGAGGTGLGQPGPGHHRTGDQRAQTCLPGGPTRQHRRRFRLSGSELDPVRQR
jgi:hypothetical protein